MSLATRPVGSVGTTRRPARPAGFRDDRRAVLFVAVAYLVLSKPDLLSFQHLVPAAIVLTGVALHLLAGTAGAAARLRLPVAVVFLVGWLAVTNVWADDHLSSSLQMVTTVLAVFVAIVVGSTCSVRAFLGGVVLGGLVVLALSLTVAAVSPSTGLMPAGYQGGALRGLYIHRNLTAEVLAPAFTAALVHRFEGRAARFRHLASVLILLGGVLLTRSSTALASIAVAVALAGVLALVRRVRPRYRPLTLAVALTAVLGVGAALVLNSSQVFAALGRDTTLTGRTTIWPLVQRLIALRPVTGYGWGSTWNDGDYVRLYISQRATWDVPSAHNGYLDATVQAGVIGLIAFLVVVALVLLLGLGLLLRASSPLALWAPLLVTGLLVYNVGEANLVSILTIFLLVATLTMLVRERRAAPDEATSSSDRAAPRSAGAEPADLPARLVG